MMKRLVSGMIIVLAGVGSAMAETYYFTRATEEPNGESAFDLPRWSLSQTPGEGEATCATAGNDYVVINSRMRTPNSGEHTFPGDSLQLGILGGKSGSLAHCGSGLVTYRKLVFANGYYVTWRNFDCLIAGPVEVTATSPFSVYSTGSTSSAMNGGLHFFGPFTGAENAELVGMSQQPGFRLTFEGDMSKYLGTIRMTRYSTSLPDSGTNSILCLASAASISGTVKLEYGAGVRALTADDSVSIGRLSLMVGSRLVVPVDCSTRKAGLVSISNLSGIGEAQPLTIAFDVTGDLVDLAEGVTLPVLEFADAGQAITTNCFVLPQSLGAVLNGADVPHISWSLQDKDGADGVRQLVLTTRPFAYQKASDPIVYTGGPSDSSFTNETAWTVAGVPHAGVDYICTNSWLSTPYLTKKTDVQRFEGDSLTLADKSTMILYSYNLAFTGPVTMLPGSSCIYHLGGSGTRTLTAPEVNIPGTLTTKEVGFECYQNSLGVLDAPLTGAGVLRVRGRSGSGAPMGGLQLVQDNSKFGGRMYVYIQDCSKNDQFLGPDETRYIWLQIDNANQLGGPIPGKTADDPCFNALELRHWAGLKVTENVTLAEPTRGVYINEYGRFVVEAEKTLVLNQQLTVNGSCRKQGAGTLVLGGALKFTSSATDTPETGKNLLSVLEGALGVAATNALDGAAVAFAAGTKLIVKRDLGTRGAVMTKAGSSLALAEGLESLPVELDLGDWTAETAPSSFAVPLVTVTTAMAESLRGMLAVAKPFPGNWTVVVQEQANADGTVTFVAACRLSGLVILIK